MTPLQLNALSTAHGRYQGGGEGEKPKPKVVTTLAELVGMKEGRW